MTRLYPCLRKTAELAASGMRDKEIASALGVTPQTAKLYVARFRQMTGLVGDSRESFRLWLDRNPEDYWTVRVPGKMMVVARLISQGWKLREIAVKLSISRHTAKYHLARFRERVGLVGRPQVEIVHWFLSYDSEIGTTKRKTELRDTIAAVKP